MSWKILAQRVNRNRQVTAYDFSKMSFNTTYEVAFWRDIEDYAESFVFNTEEEAMEKFEQIVRDYF